MKKIDYFIKAINANLYLNKSWIIRCFSIVQETKTLEQLQTFEILQNNSGHYFKNEEGQLELIEGTDKDPSQPAFVFKEKCVLPAKSLINVTEEVETTYGRILANAILIHYPVGDKISFINKRFFVSDIENILAKNLFDTPPPNEERDPKKFYVDELIRVFEASSYLSGLSLLTVPTATEKTMTIDPEIIKYRDEQYKILGDTINDRSVEAKLMQELIAMDKKSFEGDAGAGFLISGKAFNVVRKKRFIAVGSEPGLTADSTNPFIKNSLYEGIDKEKFPAYNNGSRQGSYKRGRETELGGELTKWLLRTFSNSRVQFTDCGTRVGLPIIIEPGNQTDYYGYAVVTKDGHEIIDNDNIGNYLQKSVMLRSPAFCHSSLTDYCNICLGPKLSANPDALALAASKYGSDFMGISMGAMHGKALSIERMDFTNELS